MIKLLILITLIFPFIYKYSFVITNQYTQIPIILAYMDKNYLAFDWYVNISREFGPRTIFAIYSAAFGKITGLPVVYFLHYLLTIGLTLLASYKLAYFLFKNKKAALLTGMTVLFGSTYSIGGNLLVTRDFTVTQMALAATLSGIVYILEKRYILAAVFFITASYLHPLIGPIVFFISFFSVNLFHIFKNGRKTAFEIYKLFKSGLLPYVFSIFPLIFLYLKDYQSSGASAETKINILAFVRNPHHFLPSFFPAADYISFFLTLSVCAIIILKIKQKIPAQFKVLLFCFFQFTLLLILISLASIYIKPIYPLVVIQPFRLTVFIYWLMAVLIYSFIYKMVINNKISNFFLIAPFLLSDYQRLYSFSKTNMIGILVSFLIIILFRKIPFKASVILLLMTFTFFNYHNKLNLSSYFEHPTVEVELAAWVKKNTSDQDILIVPPEFEKFRLISFRPVVADWKAFPFQEKGYLEWFNRMCDLGNQIECNTNIIITDKIISGYRTHSTESLKSLGKKYSAKYIITEVVYPQLRLVYSNQYNIYRL